MQGNGAHTMKSRVAKVGLEKSRDLLLTQATHQGCPVVVHFTAAWCMPSVATNPFFEELLLTYQDILFLLVDVVEVKEVASKMEMKAMKEGALVAQLVGSNPEEIRKRMKALVSSTPFILTVTR